MMLVTDTGILISAILKDSATREILLFADIEFLLPEYALEEYEKHRKVVSKRSGLSEKDLNIILSLLLDNIRIVSVSKIKPYLENAYKIIGLTDPFDVPFVALALATENNGIWSNDKHFESIKTIKIWKTSELMSYLKKRG